MSKEPELKLSYEIDYTPVQRPPIVDELLKKYSTPAPVYRNKWLEEKFREIRMK